MHKRITISLAAWMLGALLSNVSSAAEDARRIVGTVYGKPVTAGDIGLTAPIDVQARFDARDKPQWELMGRILRAFGSPVADRFVKEKKIEPTPAEIEQFKKKIPGAPDEMAKQMILSWKTERELHRAFGGRIIFQQFGPEALDARRKLFEAAEKNGDLKFHDLGVRHLFYYYYVNMKHTAVGAEALEEAWFLKERMAPRG